MKKKLLNSSGNARPCYVSPSLDETFLDAEEMLCLSADIEGLVVLDDDTINWN